MMNRETGMMNDRVVAGLAVRPSPRCAVSIRAAAGNDLPFIDALQKMHSHMVGFMPRGQIEKYVAGGHVLLAEESPHHEGPNEHEAGTKDGSGSGPSRSSLGRNSVCSGSSAVKAPIGYIMFRDQYMKRDDVGIIYQLNVLPLRQRHLVGAMLVKAAFERAAYGCRLFCCWCAQDIQANWFWESIGFIPLAFRTGSAAKQRIHIFWERRVREGDDSTPYWFPSQTAGGAVGEDRIVLPIPPDTHWRDAKPVLLPDLPAPEPEQPLTLPGGQPVRPRAEQSKLNARERAAMIRAQSRHLGGAPIGKKAVLRGGRIAYVTREDYLEDPDSPDLWAQPRAKKPTARRPSKRHDPKYLAAARELRDRYLEQVNTGRLLPESSGKYDVGRALEAGRAEGVQPEPVKGLLDAA